MALSSSGLSSIIEIVGEVGAMVISNVLAKQNNELQAKYEKDLQELNKQQLQELASNLQIINNEQYRLQYFTTYIDNAIQKKIQSDIENKYLSGTKSQTRTIYWIFGGIIVLLGMVFVIKKLNK
jgi:hypothetical protein